MDKTFIKDLLVRGIIGIRDWEREKVQDILINVTVFSDTTRAAETDDIADCVVLASPKIGGAYVTALDVAGVKARYGDPQAIVKGLHMIGRAAGVVT